MKLRTTRNVAPIVFVLLIVLIGCKKGFAGEIAPHFVAEKENS